MSNKRDLLIELGWDENLLRLYLINDSESDDSNDQQFIAEIFDSNSLTVTFNAENSSSIFKIRG